MLVDAAATPAVSAMPVVALRQSVPTRFEVSQQPLPPPPFAPADAVAQWKEFQPATSKLMRLLWSTDADGALRRLLTLPEALSKPAVASLGSFFASKQPEDEQRLLVLLGALQRGDWAILAGRVDQRN